MSLAPSSDHVMPPCFMRLATTFLHALSTCRCRSADRDADTAVIHPLFVLREIVDLALEVVAVLLGVATAGVQFLEFLDHGGHAPLTQQATQRSKEVVNCSLPSPYNSLAIFAKWSQACQKSRICQTCCPASAKSAQVVVSVLRLYGV